MKKILLLLLIVATCFACDKEENLGNQELNGTIWAYSSEWGYFYLEFGKTVVSSHAHSNIVGGGLYIGTKGNYTYDLNIVDVVFIKGSYVFGDNASMSDGEGNPVGGIIDGTHTATVDGDELTMDGKVYYKVDYP